MFGGQHPRVVTVPYLHAVFLCPGVSTLSSSTSKCCGSWFCWGRLLLSWRPHQQSHPKLSWHWSGELHVIKQVIMSHESGHMPRDLDGTHFRVLISDL